MRGVAHDPVLRAKLMAQHELGVPLAVLSEQSGIARPVLSRWWRRYQADDLPGLQPRSRRPHRSPTAHDASVGEAIDLVRDFGKVERFIKTIDDECYRVVRPRSSRARVGALRLFMEYYNHARPHQSLDGASPVGRRDAYFAEAGA